MHPDIREIQTVIEAEAGTVNVGFRRLPEGEGRDQVNELLDGIAKEAAGQ